MFDFICTIQYNGKAFSGWSKQKSAKTIQGTIEKAIQRVTKNANFKTIGASKTDAGVHALDQKMLLVLDFEPELKQFRQALNAVIKPDINIIAIEKTTADFHIRSCRQKEYQYTINLGAYDLLNADKVRLTGKKESDKIYYHHSMYPGGLKRRNVATQRDLFPERIVERAVRLMLPKTVQGGNQYRALHVYAGETHPHDAQKPEVLVINTNKGDNK
jgi:ribosomal protein L13